MRRRKFLLASGSAILGGGSSFLSQQPSVALDFTISGVPEVNPSDVNTIAIEFETFNLKSNYIDDSQDADVTISLTVEDKDPSRETTKVSLVNGQPTDVSDIREATPVIKKGISTTDNIIVGDVVVSVDHPDVSDSFRQGFTISSSDIAVQSIVAEDDLAGWWPLNENTGNVIDYSGNNNDGTVNGGVTQGVAGRQGITAYSFDGSDDYIDSFGFSSGSNNFTISLWIKPSDKNNDQRVLQIGGLNNNSVHIADGSYGDIPDDEIGFFDSSNDSAISHPISYDIYQHVVITYDGSEFVMYVDGSDVDSTTNISPSSTNSLTIGSDGSSNYYLKSVLQDVRIYNRALSPTEVGTVYQKGTGDFTRQSLHDGTDSNSVARYALDGNLNDKWGTNTGSQSGVSFTSNAIRGQAGGFQSSNNDLIDAGDFADGLNDYTVSAWINPDSLTGITNIVKKDGGGIRNKRHFSLRIEDSNGRISVFSRDKDGNSLKTVSDRTVSANNWAFVAGRVKDDTAEVYVNGEQKKSDSDPSYTRHPASSEPVQIGGDNVGGFLYYDGSIDDVRIYNRALSNSEIRQLYLYGTRGKDLRPYLENINT